MKIWDNNGTRNTGTPYGVRWNDGTGVKQKSFATQTERETFKAQLRLGLADVETETFGSAVRRAIARKTSARTRDTYTGTLIHLKPIMGMPVADVALRKS